MDREFFLKVACATHRVANILPEQGQVRNDIKDTATNIAALLFSPESKRDILHIVKEIQQIQGYFQVAKSQRWIDAVNFLILEKEYEKIIELLEQSENSIEEHIEPAPDPIAEAPSLSERQKKILEILRGKEKTQVWELQKVLPEVTKRTLRRDLDDLLQLNLVERQGEWNEVFYTIK
jgi:DNA mismatch repair ATPase MutS